MKLFLKALACFALMPSLVALAQGDAAQGGEKSSLCASCHGMDGNSTVAMWPKLAGQHESYLARQLQLIKDGNRQVLEMTGIVAMLSDEDIANISAYYASQEANPAVADPELVDLGERIYRAGNPDSEVPACMGCHGPAGEGNPLAGYPALAGQHAQYTAKMLTAFEDGANWGEDDAPSNIMAGVASNLSKDEINAVSSYIQGLYSKGTE